MSRLNDGGERSCVDRGVTVCVCAGDGLRVSPAGEGNHSQKHRRGQADSNLTDLQISAADWWLQVVVKGEDVDLWSRRGPGGNGQNASPSFLNLIPLSSSQMHLGGIYFQHRSSIYT